MNESPAQHLCFYLYVSLSSLSISVFSLSNLFLSLYVRVSLYFFPLFSLSNMETSLSLSSLPLYVRIFLNKFFSHRTLLGRDAIVQGAPNFRRAKICKSIHDSDIGSFTYLASPCVFNDDYLPGDAKQASMSSQEVTRLYVMRAAAVLYAAGEENSCCIEWGFMQHGRETHVTSKKISCKKGLHATNKGLHAAGKGFYEMDGLLLTK